MSFIIREGVRSDMPSVLKLVKELAHFEKEENAVVVSVEDLERDGFGEYPLFRVFIAEKNGEIVGMALFYERYSTWKGRSIHLEDLIVKKAFRGEGIGKALYTKVLSFAHQKELKRVSWEVLDWNKVAVDFYVSTGAKILDGWQVVHMNEHSLQNFIAQE